MPQHAVSVKYEYFVVSLRWDTAIEIKMKFSMKALGIPAFVRLEETYNI